MTIMLLQVALLCLLSAESLAYKDKASKDPFIRKTREKISLDPNEADCSIFHRQLVR